ncbi:MAG: transposase [Armatimonadetes bacterium]|nr:transposase [Armatimonadota bacterium]
MPRFDPDRHHRRSTRLRGYDYSRGGAYFVTLCTQHRLCLFGQVCDGEMDLSDAGRVVERLWTTIPEYCAGVEVDAPVVMPNHLHGVLVLPYDGSFAAKEIRSAGGISTRPHGTDDGSLGRIVQEFKTASTCEYGFGVRHYGWTAYEGRLWQRNYHDRIVRNQDELERIRAYILNNPATWAFDAENPECCGSTNMDGGGW